MLKNPLVEYYRIPESAFCFELLGEPSESPGYFRFGEDTIAYGRTCTGLAAKKPDSQLNDLLPTVEVRDSKCLLPFDPSEVLNNLRREKYALAAEQGNWAHSLRRKAYYILRPLLPFAVRSRLKRMTHRGWKQKPFPSWPVDHSVENTLESLMVLALQTQRIEKVPFIWFWPRDYSGCVLMTHDVETKAGLESCPSLMDLNDSYGVKSSFQLVPEGRYAVSPVLLQQIRERGCEINVHDWNHDGLLFSDRKLFLERAEKINRAARCYGAEGFRSGALYRNLDWYDAFTFSYDMSVPNVGHLDPQPGGCCTAMPYFVGRILEIPVTMIQDYMLFHLMGDYSIALWQRQLQLVLERNGLASFIIHPDYIIDRRARATYTELLKHLAELRKQRNIWIAVPNQVNHWWRSRNQMKLVQRNGSWEIDGPGKEQARVAWARLDGQRLAYSLES
jgi:hypothetical protein